MLYTGGESIGVGNNDSGGGMESEDI